MLTARIEKIRQNYVNAKPQISCERAALWTESYCCFAKKLKRL